MAKVHSMHMPDLVRQITLHVKVTGQRRTSIRFRIGCQVLKFAAVVMGCGIEVQIDDKVQTAGGNA